MFWRFKRSCVAILALTACRSTIDAPESLQIEGMTPVQFDLTRDPVVSRHPVQDSNLIIVSLDVADSVPHRAWEPTVVRLSTDRGSEFDALAIPYACLVPGDSTQ